MSPRVAQIETLLQAKLTPDHVAVVDESHLHAGHEGARSGGGHYAVTVVATQFAGLDTLKRHRLVYAALQEMMYKDIHALTIRALTPDEYFAGGTAR